MPLKTEKYPFTVNKPVEATATDPLHLIDVDHVKLYAGNAKQAAFYYAYTFGFQVAQFDDLTTGNREEASYLLTQGNIRLIITTGLKDNHPAQRHIKLYGDGVKDIAFTVFDAQRAFDQAVKNGAEIAYEPFKTRDEHGEVVRAGIKTYGEVLHSFVSRSGKYALPELKQGGIILPGFKAMEHPLNQYNKDNPCGLKFLDHCVGNVQIDQMNNTVDWYQNTLGFSMFKHFDDEDISTEYSALMSKVMSSGGGLIKFPINEPANGKRKSQIQEYLDWHNNTAGVQHLAFRTDDAIDSIKELRKRGVSFLTLPDTYYELLWDRVGDIEEEKKLIQELGILVDRDDQGYLLQLFTRPVQDRPTLFFEIICRRGSQSFGKGNFKALFEALELEQNRRGNL
ncbi:MAG: 4-hydroxyphenylpyruvate dioxygenase [Phycisphaerae bacterium]|jgi:4-hydroxyphenylpyruvate dioxygenase|nr:4-hydroxyphenylpyruvate dioxygenase [Phycisphaerae bacterium]